MYYLLYLINKNKLDIIIIGFMMFAMVSSNFKDLLQDSKF